MAGDEGYLLDNQQVEAGDRITALASLFDPWTFRHLEELGMVAGWRCWEVGAGGPSVAAWMSGRGGSVLATDIDVSRLGGDRLPFEVRVHDIGVDAPPPGPFDLIHARLVLVPVPRRREAVGTMARALRPGGGSSSRTPIRRSSP